MEGKYSGNHAASADSQWGVVLAMILAGSAACVFLATGCASQPLYVVGLRPELPRVERISQLDTLRPTFRWEPFPRAQDLVELAPHGGERIAAVSYELRLWKVGKEFSEIGVAPTRSQDPIEAASDYKYSWRHECRDTDPGKLVHTKQGLLTPEHNLEFPLQPNSLYFWTVRAHFTLDGKRRVTEWSEVFPHFYGNVDLVFASREDGCSYPATFHLIRTPKEQDS